MLLHIRRPLHWSFLLQGPAQELLRHARQFAEYTIRFFGILGIEQRQRNPRPMRINQPFERAIAAHNAVVIAGAEQRPMIDLAQKRARLMRTRAGQKQQPAIDIPAEFFERLMHSPWIETLGRCLLLIDARGGIGIALENHQAKDR